MNEHFISRCPECRRVYQSGLVDSEKQKAAKCLGCGKETTADLWLKEKCRCGECENCGSTGIRFLVEEVYFVEGDLASKRVEVHDYLPHTIEFGNLRCNNCNNPRTDIGIDPADIWEWALNYSIPVSQDEERKILDDQPDPICFLQAKEDRS